MPNLFTAAAVLDFYSRAELDEKIARLEQECAEAGDLDAVRVCRRALAGVSVARRTCARWIASANAAAVD